MGPHRESGYVQIIESIRANADRVRIVAFERAPLDGGEPARALPDLHDVVRPQHRLPARITC